MKKTKLLVYGLFLSFVVCFSACESTIQTIIGEYSFKVSGQVTKDASKKVVLSDEVGTMEIIHLNDSNFLLTFNTINGCAYKTQAVLSKNRLDLQPFSRTITITYKTQDSDILGGIIETTEIEHYNTDVYGHGIVYGNTIDFQLQYSGEEIAGNNIKIKGNNIIMLAKKNE